MPTATPPSAQFLAIRQVLNHLVFQLRPMHMPVLLDDSCAGRHHGLNIIHIHALIWVERQSQKSIVIGKQGRVLKEVGQEARGEIEQLLGSRVNLKLWVKVKEGWADDERALRSLGYVDED